MQKKKDPDPATTGSPGLQARTMFAYRWEDPRFPHGSGKYIVCPVLEPADVTEALARVSRGDTSSLSTDLDVIAEWRDWVSATEDIQAARGGGQKPVKSRRKQRWLEHVRHVLSKLPASQRPKARRGRPWRDPRVEIDQVRGEILALAPDKRLAFVAAEFGIRVEAFGRRRPTSEHTLCAVVHVRRHPEDRGLPENPEDRPRFDIGATAIRISESNHRRSSHAKSRPAFFTG